MFNWVYAFISVPLILLPVFAHANLVDEVEKLSPEQVHQFKAKLQAKIAHPIPESVFTKLAVTVSGDLHFAHPTDFANSLNPKHTEGNRYRTLRSIHAGLLWRFTDRLYFGFGFGSIQKSSTKEVNLSQFEDAQLKGVFYQIQAAYKLPLRKYVALLPIIGLGGVRASGRINHSNDNTNTTYEFKYNGNSWSALTGASFLVEINKTLNLGLETGYFHGRVRTLKRSGETEIVSPGDIDLSGVFAGVKLAVNL